MRHSRSVLPPSTALAAELGHRGMTWLRGGVVLRSGSGSCIAAASQSSACPAAGPVCRETEELREADPPEKTEPARSLPTRLCERTLL
jgi:hypothetical protein